MGTQLIALSLGVALAGCSTMNSAAGSLGTMPAPARAAALHQDMRRLWSDHVVWTRQYIVAAVAGTPDAPVALARLMRNQDDIGNAIKPYYGDAAGAKLTDLLKQHISLAGEVVAAAKAGDQAKLQDADRRWHDNAGEIATFLSSANPNNWPHDAVLSMLNNHLALTTREATDRIKANWSDDQQAFDAVYTQIMGMADTLADGIIKQFPTKV